MQFDWAGKRATRVGRGLDASSQPIWADKRLLLKWDEWLQQPHLTRHNHVAQRLAGGRGTSSLYPASPVEKAPLSPGYKRWTSSLSAHAGLPVVISSWLERSTVSSGPGKWGKGPRLSEGLLLFPTWVNGTTTQGTVGDHTGYPVGDRTGQPVGEGVAARAAIAHRTRTACNLKDGRWVDLN